MTVIEGAKLSRFEGKACRAIAGLLGTMCLAGCAGPDRRTVPSYDPVSRRLVQLAGDLDGDGRLDQWTYLDGSGPVRGEADTNGDGRVDRWEYFDQNALLERVGVSSQQDGVEDRWTWAAGGDERRVDVSRSRDRRIDRREYFRGDQLVRAEQDDDGDGLTDRWDRFEEGVLREAAFDTSHHGLPPDRRLLYDARGQFLRLEVDTDRDGMFVAAPGPSGRPQ